MSSDEPPDVQQRAAPPKRRGSGSGKSLLLSLQRLFRSSKAGPDHVFQIVLVGDSFAGKTSLVRRFTQNAYSCTGESTCGVDFCAHNLEHEERQIRFQIWDTAGMDRFDSVTSAYLPRADAVLFVFDCGSTFSLQRVHKWHTFVSQNVHPADEPVMLLVGNKCDLQERSVSTKQAQQVAVDLHIPYAEVSARTGEHVVDVFDGLACCLIDKLRQRCDIGKVRPATVKRHMPDLPCSSSSKTAFRRCVPH